MPISPVESLEKIVSQSLRKWLGLPRSLTNIALYGHSTKLKLPFSSVTEEFKVSRAREVMQYRDSDDPMVSTANISVRTGRKWRAQEAVDRAETRLNHSVIVGNVATGRAGLGSFPKQSFDKATPREKRRMVLEEVRSEEEEHRRSKMVAMSQQGAWTRWEQVEQRNISWTDLWKAEPYRIRFLVCSVYDVLPSPTNLRIWRLSDSPSRLGQEIKISGEDCHHLTPP